MKKLKAYQVGCPDGCADRQYCNLVFAYNANEARKISYCDGGAVGYMGLRAGRVKGIDNLVDPDKATAYRVEDSKVFRAAGWRNENEEPCHVCGLFACGIDAYQPCDECGHCRSCGHHDDCPLRPGTEEGSICSRNGCEGVIQFYRDGECTCFIAPPCGSCVDAYRGCPVCGWDEVNDPIGECDTCDHHNGGVGSVNCIGCGHNEVLP